MLERLRNNWQLKIASFLIALGIWCYLRFSPNPVIAARFVQQLSVPIATTGLRSDYVADFAEKSANVSFAIPRGAGEVRVDDVRAVLDLSGRGPGVYNVPVQVIAPTLEIKSLSPATVTLTIERIEERSFPVSLRYVGERPRVVVSAASVMPAFATLRAPTSELARVASVRVEVPLPAAPVRFDAMERPVATDARGNDLSDVTIAPNLLRVQATFIPASKGR